ncbi:MAG: hypothetical protein LBB93_00275 [Elusimicrobiota bacterium]|nr:hypothetical protein [Elusimicrobiota bacterium]
MITDNLIFDLSDFLDNKRVSRKVDVSHFDIGCDSSIKADIKALKVSEKSIQISGTLSGFLILECSRCLFVYRHPVEIDINCDIPFIDSKADAGEEIRQMLILEIPMKPLCSKQCLGICQLCGRHNKLGDSCSCVAKAQEKSRAMVAERWKELLKQN